MSSVIAIDAGTTGVRSLLVDASGAVVDVAYRELTQSYPSPGWVEHDAEEIWHHVVETLNEVRNRNEGADIAAIGITNQRETVVAFDRADGRVLGPALVWQDKRTADRCEELRSQGALDEVRAATGLVLDPYFSATKMAWLIEAGSLAQGATPALGTVDAWIAWKLTGGPDGGQFVTDASNASRTLLFDIDEMAWSERLCEIFGVDQRLLPRVVASCGRIGVVADPRLSTVAWDLGDHGGVSYALEGSAFVAGAAIQWLRDKLGIISSAADTEALARQVDSTEGLSFVPAFVGLGSPWWDASARGAIVGITRGSGRATLTRAVVDSLAYEVRAITDAMAQASGQALAEIRVDGGAAAMDLLLAHQAEQSKAPVIRPTSLETTALGAAKVAGLAEGVWGSMAELERLWEASAIFSPTEGFSDLADAAYASWCDAVSRSRKWA